MKSSSSSFSLSSDNWSRPIFGLTSDYKSLSRDEREERDWAHLSQIARRRLRCVHVYVSVFLISLYGAPLAQRASYLALHSSLFGPVAQLIMIILSLTALTLC